jgi:hypothetical protein
VYEAKLDLPNGSPRNDACEGERSSRNALQRGQGIRRERDARGKVPAKDRTAQVCLLRQPACHCCVKVARGGKLCEPERCAQQDVRSGAIKEDGEIGESMHIMQRALE